MDAAITKKMDASISGTDFQEKYWEIMQGDWPTTIIVSRTALPGEGRQANDAEDPSGRYELKREQPDADPRGLYYFMFWQHRTKPEWKIRFADTQVFRTLGLDRSQARMVPVLNLAPGDRPAPVWMIHNQNPNVLPILSSEVFWITPDGRITLGEVEYPHAVWPIGEIKWPAGIVVAEARDENPRNAYFAEAYRSEFAEAPTDSSSYVLPNRKVFALREWVSRAWKIDSSTDGHVKTV